MTKLFQQFIKSIKFSFNEENSNIKYEEYIINGIPIPKDIELKDITTSSVNIYWKIDDINIDKNDIKYKVELKEENKNYIKIYAGNNLNNFVENLLPNTIYEIRIYSIYKGDLGG